MNDILKTCFILLSTAITFVFVIKKFNRLLEKVLGSHHFKSKSIDYFKSKTSYYSLKHFTMITLYFWLIATIYFFYVFIFLFDVEYLFLSLFSFVVIPVMYRLNIKFQIFLNKKR